jgi:hypothetical protein
MIIHWLPASSTLVPDLHVASPVWRRDMQLDMLETQYVYTPALSTSRIADIRAPHVQGVRAYVYESKVFVSMVLILIFAEVLGLYGYVSILSFHAAGSSTSTA